MNLHINLHHFLLIQRILILTLLTFVFLFLNQKPLRVFLNLSKENDEDLYEDSLSEFLKAEALMPQDYFTNYYLGLIYLTSPSHLDIEKSNSYFIKSSKYSSLELTDDSVLLENVLDNDSIGGSKKISCISKNWNYWERENRRIE